MAKPRQLATVLGVVLAISAQGWGAFPPPQPPRRVNTVRFSWPNQTASPSPSPSNRAGRNGNTYNNQTDVFDLIGKATQALQQKDLGGAASWLRQARIKAGGNYKAPLDELARQIDRAAQGLLERADTLAENRDVIGARQIYQVLSGLGTPVSAKARQKMTELAQGQQSNLAPAESLAEAVQSAIAAQRAKLQPAQQARREFAPLPADKPADETGAADPPALTDLQLVKTLPLQQQVELLAKLRLLVRGHQDSDPALAAKPLLDALEDDQEFQANLQRHQDEQDAGKKYQLAEHYQAYKFADKAKGFYMEVVAAYPGTQAAQKARLQLASLNEKS
jgi:hypothetical protein